MYRYIYIFSILHMYVLFLHIFVCLQQGKVAEEYALEDSQNGFVRMIWQMKQVSLNIYNICIHVYAYAHTHAHTHACTHTYACVRTHIHTHRLTHTITHTHMYICMYMYIHMHTYVYTQ